VRPKHLVPPTVKKEARNMVKVGLIGYGRIGKEVEKRVLQRGWEIPIIARSSGIYNSRKKKIDELSNWLKYFNKVDVAVLCIPTIDDGATAYNYIKTLVENGIPTVTTEKGAMGNYFHELKNWVLQGKIGFSAVVGGGTRLLHWVKWRLSPRTAVVLLIINGTLNYIFDGLARGRPLEEVVEEAKILGYAEPGAQTPLEVINTEACKDVPMKIAAVINICGFGEVRAKEIQVKSISEKDEKRLVREAAFRRYIVSITKEEDEEDIIGGFKFKLDSWYISGGFKNRNHNPLFLHLVPPGVNNAALIYGDDGTYILTGPGAGAQATVLGAVMWDIENLSKSS
jgi:homoserine dehydrogenase